MHRIMHDVFKCDILKNVLTPMNSKGLFTWFASTLSNADFNAALSSNAMLKRVRHWPFKAQPMITVEDNSHEVSLHREYCHRNLLYSNLKSYILDFVTLFKIYFIT